MTLKNKYGETGYSNYMLNSGHELHLIDKQLRSNDLSEEKRKKLEEARKKIIEMQNLYTEKQIDAVIAKEAALQKTDNHK